ncbi:MAG: hypothetical protein WC785_09445 [Tatlockia sp.]|jgi:hypothetical protein
MKQLENHQIRDQAITQLVQASKALQENPKNAKAIFASLGSDPGLILWKVAYLLRVVENVSLKDTPNKDVRDALDFLAYYLIAVHKVNLDEKYFNHKSAGSYLAEASKRFHLKGVLGKDASTFAYSHSFLNDPNKVKSYWGDLADSILLPGLIIAAFTPFLMLAPPVAALVAAIIVVTLAAWVAAVNLHFFCKAVDKASDKVQSYHGENKEKSKDAPLSPFKSFSPESIKEYQANKIANQGNDKESKDARTRFKLFFMTQKTTENGTENSTLTLS